MALINFNTSLHLDKGLLSSQGLPSASSSLPPMMDKLALPNMNYTTEVDKIYTGSGFESSLIAWAQPPLTKPETLEPTRFSEALSQAIPQIQQLIAKASPQDAVALKNCKYALEDTVSLRELARTMQLALLEG